jgi:nucleoside-diphosphate-sugar epimerase
VKILLTGASSFTGMWFARELARAGHEVVATFRKRPEEYADDLRRRRVSMALEVCRGVFGCSFGDPAFLDLVRRERWDLFCHHAADVTNYKSPDFDLVSALANNTRNAASVLEALKTGGQARPRLLVTGSVFENDEGAGSEGLPAFSPYGLSKGFTWQVFRYHAARTGLPLGKFVIPNPFGPYEDPRFTAYLIKSWFAGQTAAVNTPEYVRDNIHVSLLAKAYAKFAGDLPDRPGMHQIHPSGYPESQGAFALRFAKEMRPRLGLPCEVELKRQVNFQEPRVRINTDLIDGQSLGWDETRAWDEIAEYYKGLFRLKNSPTEQ